VSLTDLLSPLQSRIKIRNSLSGVPTAVDAYWSRHTVNSKPFSSATESEQYLRWRSAQYPLFPELMDVWGDHRGETLLDYGCGPGDDLVGFLLYSGAAKVIGIDVSPKALELSRKRIALHRIPARQVELILIGDSQRSIPIAADRVDYINCGGVLHHTSNPEAILREFSRILRPAGCGRVMVYNRQSLWFHLYVAYVRMILDNSFAGQSVEQAFGRSTDGEDCPVSVAYEADRFLRMLSENGLNGKFLGGYLSVFELECWRKYGLQAIDDSRLARHHRDFLAELEFDENGLPKWRGGYAGIGGVYEFKRA
jgi:SAM-dependent methyltransferase